MKPIAITSSLKKKRKIFGWVFVASILLFFGSNILFTMSPIDSLPGTPKPDLSVPVIPTPSPPLNDTSPTASWIDTAIIVSAISLLTSLTSLIGFISTTVLAWRKEKRETISSELEIRKKELELEKLRMELGKSEESRKNKNA